MTDLEIASLEDYVLNIFRQNSLAICRVGSSLVNVTSFNVDFFVVMSEILPDELIESFFSKNIEITKLDDSFRFRYGEKICNIAVFSESDFRLKIKKILECKNYGEHREWTIGYWLPEALLFDVLKAKVIYDKELYIYNTRKIILNEFDSYKRKILKRISSEISILTKKKNYNDFFQVSVYCKTCYSLLRLYNLAFDLKLSNFKDIQHHALNGRLSESFDAIFSEIVPVNSEITKRILGVCMEVMHE